MDFLSLLAAAGAAEASWKATMVIIVFAFLIPNGLAFLAMLTRSYWCSVAAAAIFVLFSLLFQPWFGFIPLRPQDYEDPDVVDAAAGFLNMSIYWVCSFLFVGFSCTLVYLMLRALEQNKASKNLPAAST